MLISIAPCLKQLETEMIYSSSQGKDADSWQVRVAELKAAGFGQAHTQETVMDTTQLRSLGMHFRVPPTGKR